MRDVRGNGCTIAWSPNGRFVEKRYDRMWWWFLDHRHDKFERERRVGMLLRRQPAPVRSARLLSADRRRRTIRFEAIDGEPFGPKYPRALPDHDLDLLVEMASAMLSFRPRAGFARRFDVRRRVQRAVDAGTLSPTDAAAFLRDATADPPNLVFGHGDITARNVLRPSSGPPVLIDWEWAGLYPRGWDLAFLWFSLIDVEGGRERVAAAVPPRDGRWFWRSALLIQLLHLSLRGLAVGTPFRARHERERDDLVARVVHGEFSRCADPPRERIVAT